MGVTMTVFFYGLIAFVLPNRQTATNSPSDVGDVSAVFVKTGHTAVLLVEADAIDTAKAEFSMIMEQKAYLGWSANNQEITFDVTAGKVSVVPESGCYSILDHLADVQEASGLYKVKKNLDVKNGGVEIKAGTLSAGSPGAVVWKYHYMDANDNVYAADASNHKQQLATAVRWTVDVKKISIGGKDITLKTGGKVFISNLPTELPEPSNKQLKHYKHVYSDIVDATGGDKMYIPVNDGTTAPIPNPAPPAPLAASATSKPSKASKASGTKSAGAETKSTGGGVSIGLRPDSCPPPIAYKKKA